MTTLKVITLGLLWLIFAALLIFFFSLIAYRLVEVSRADEYNIGIGSTYGEVDR